MLKICILALINESIACKTIHIWLGSVASNDFFCNFAAFFEFVLASCTHVRVILQKKHAIQTSEFH